MSHKILKKETYFKRVESEFMILPTFNIDTWFDFESKFFRVITIGWLFWFVRFIRPINLKVK